MERNPEHFKHITDKFGTLGIDLFASRINKQIDRYVSWHQEPDAMASTTTFTFPHLLASKFR